MHQLKIVIDKNEVGSFSFVFFFKNYDIKPFIVDKLNVNPNISTIELMMSRPDEH